jgi:hypothetical protein
MRTADAKDTADEDAKNGRLGAKAQSCFSLSSEYRGTMVLSAFSENVRPRARLLRILFTCRGYHSHWFRISPLWIFHVSCAGKCSQEHMKKVKTCYLELKVSRVTTFIHALIGRVEGIWGWRFTPSVQFAHLFLRWNILCRRKEALLSQNCWELHSILLVQNTFLHSWSHWGPTILWSALFFSVHTKIQKMWLFRTYRIHVLMQFLPVSMILRNV